MLTRWEKAYGIWFLIQGKAIKNLPLLLMTINPSRLTWEITSQSDFLTRSSELLLYTRRESSLRGVPPRYDGDHSNVHRYAGLYSLLRKESVWITHSPDGVFLVRCMKEGSVTPESRSKQHVAVGDADDNTWHTAKWIETDSSLYGV